jgi:FADH2 O2-dependent halogenase
LSLPDEATVVVVGGGPAGSAAGAYLAKAGIDHVILERDRFPRHHVGESLVAASNRVLHEIGVLDTIDREGFTRKRGAVWVPRSGRNFAEVDIPADPRFGGRDYTYQVERARFDKILLDHAASLGSRVEEETVVTDALTEGDRVTGVRARRNGETRDIRARFVVDASGRGTFLGSRFRLKKKDPLFDQYAIYSYFKGMDRGPAATADHIHIHFLPTSRGWCWQIPLNPEITSVGVVTEREDFRRDGRDPGAYFRRHIDTQPELSRRLEGAIQTDVFRTEGDYSYSMDKLSGPGFVLVGDAARFVDPIFSSGVSVALNSARFAMAALIPALRGERDEAEARAEYEARLAGGIRTWYEFIKIYYKLQNLFTHYLRKPSYKVELIRLLQGDVYDPDEITILDRLRADIQKIESTPGHAMQASLTDIPL